MGFLVDSGIEAVGSVKPWLRPTAAIPLPGNWVILDGSVLVDPDSSFNGHTLPDMRTQFLAGHPTLTNANFGADANYRTSGGGTIPTGGVASHNLQHNHPGGAHTHTIAGHTHSIGGDGNHAHTTPNHAHSVSGGHNHSIGNDVTLAVSAGLGPAYSSSPLTLEWGFANPFNHNHSHSHGGSTGFSGVFNTDFGGGGATNFQGSHSHGGSTGTGAGSSGAASGNTDDALSTIDNRPPYIGLLLIMKVK